MNNLKIKLLEYLKQDTDFQPFLSFLVELVESIEIDNYILDKPYLDISYIVIDDVIINLDEIYFYCKDYFKFL
jgi:hypothetical protein